MQDVYTPDDARFAKGLATYGVGATIRYSFVSESEAPGNSFSSAQQQAVEAIFRQIESITNVTFVSIADDQSHHNRIRFVNGVVAQDAGAGLTASQPDQNGVSFVGITISNTVFGSSDRAGVALGGFMYSALMHEIGHALGLKHVNPSDPGATGDLFSDGRGHTAATVMSYVEYAEYHLPEHPEWTYPISPMLLDVQALRDLYGGPKAGAVMHGVSLAADNTYTFLSQTGNENNFFSIYKNQIKTIWDTGGNGDTFDASSYVGAGAQELIIDLNPGRYSSIGGTDNIAIAFGTSVENAIGGSAADTITGNDEKNTLDGRDGSDTLIGGKKDDILKGGDALTPNNAAVDTLDGGADFDTYRH